MVIFVCIQGRLIRSRFGSFGLLAAAALALLLLVAAPANADELAGAPAPAVATESPVAAEPTSAAPVPVSVEQPPEMAAATEAGVPVEPPEAEEVASVATEVVASASPSPTPRLQDIAADDGEPSTVKPEDLIGSTVREVREVTTPQHQVTSQHQVAELVEGVRRRSGETVSATADRLLGISKSELDLLPGLVDLAAPSQAERSQSAGDTPADAGPREAWPAAAPELHRHAALLQSPDAIGLRPSLGEYIAAGSTSAIGPIRGAAARDWQTGLSPRAAILETGFASANTDRAGDPTPTDLPSPAPGSPTTAVSDPGGPSFVPIVALLALLALVAPTALRRLGKALDFHAPTPFVCALERPG